MSGAAVKRGVTGASTRAPTILRTYTKRKLSHGPSALTHIREEERHDSPASRTAVAQLPLNAPLATLTPKPFLFSPALPSTASVCSGLSVACLEASLPTKAASFSSSQPATATWPQLTTSYSSSSLSAGSFSNSFSSQSNLNVWPYASGSVPQTHSLNSVGLNQILMASSGSGMGSGMPVHAHDPAAAPLLAAFSLVGSESLGSQAMLHLMGSRGLSNGTLPSALWSREFQEGGGDARMADYAQLLQANSAQAAGAASVAAPVSARLAAGATLKPLKNSTGTINKTNNNLLQHNKTNNNLLQQLAAANWTAQQRSAQERSAHYASSTQS